ncbi:MAG: MFS transporter [Clostridia bacterium]|nr:MFS transporter [Clostridia bacterium]
MKNEITRSLDTKPQYKRDRILYIIEATVEYFIAILTSGAYMTKVALNIGMSDTMVALLSSALTFTCAFQLFAMFFNKYKHPKRWLTVTLFIIEAAFTFIYIIPIVPFPENSRPILLAAAVLIGNIVYNISAVSKSSWMIGYVADDRRGNFSGIMQSVSLISGMAVTYVAGAVIDYFEANNDMRGAFLTIGAVVLACSIIHIILFLSMTEIPNEGFINVSIRSQVKAIVKNKSLMKILPICAFYYISSYIAIPFYSTYTQKELGFSMTFIAVLSAIAAIVRTASNVFMGKLGDKYGFVTLKGVGAVACALALFINIFTVPENGSVLYTTYTVIYSMAAAASGIATTNLIYEYAPLELRTGALAINGTLYGFASFFATLVATPLVDYLQGVQRSGGTFLGMHVYAQQVVFAIGCILMLLTFVYICTVGRSAKNRHE